MNDEDLNDTSAAGSDTGPERSEQERTAALEL
jgi:hypothetical protein